MNVVPIEGGLDDIESSEVFPFTRLRESQGVFVASTAGTLKLEVIFFY